MRLYKSTIVIWTDFNPVTLQLAELAHEADVGDAYCSKLEAQVVNEPTNDPDWDGTEFFNVGQEEP